MQSFHNVIDEYLGTDATIDGAVVARAAAAGIAADPEDMPGLKSVVGDGKEEGK
jgi:hypothetical protein